MGKIQWNYMTEEQVAEKIKEIQNLPIGQEPLTEEEIEQMSPEELENLPDQPVTGKSVKG